MRDASTVLHPRRRRLWRAVAHHPREVAGDVVYGGEPALALRVDDHPHGPALLTRSRSVRFECCTGVHTSWSLRSSSILIQYHLKTVQVSILL